MRPTELLVSMLIYSSVSSAWPSDLNRVGAAFQHEVVPLVKRQESSKFDLSFTGVEGNTATTETSASPTPTDGNTSTTDDNASQSTGGSQTGSNTASATGSEKTTGTAKQTGTKSGKSTGTGTKTSQTTFDARLPAGGVSMITPNALTSSYFKINNFITFAWNYTSLSVTPSAIDILASCSLNQQTYTIALNQTVQPTQKIIWDTGAYQANATVPLLTETYTLIIHDAAQDVSAAPMAGYLGTYNQFTFGMYSPQPYTPIANWVCATCNSAMTQAERQTMWAIFGMVGVTVLSFGWFTGVAGLW